MGRDKATLRLGADSLVKRAFDTARQVFDEVFIVSSLHPAFEGVEAKVYPDILPLKGSLVGIASALLYARHPYVCVLACDMPLLSAPALRYMVSRVGGEDVIIPRTEKGYEPLHAIYGRACLAPMLRALGRQRMKVLDLMALLSVKVLEPDPVFVRDGESIFMNLNTERDLETFATIVAREGATVPGTGGRP